MERKINQLSINELYSIAVLLDYDDLLRFCSSNKRINDLICNKNDIWNYRLLKDFPDNSIKINPRKVYQKLNNLVNKAKEIMYLYNLFLLNPSDENVNNLIIKIDEYFPTINMYSSSVIIQNDYPQRIYLLSHIIDNTDKELKHAGIFPITGIRQYLEDYGINWERIFL